MVAVLKVHSLYLLFLLTSTLTSTHPKPHNLSRILLESQEDEDQPPIIKNKSTPTKNHTTLIKPSFKNTTKLTKSNPSNSTLKSHLKKLNSTSKLIPNLASDLPKLSSSKNKTTTKKETKAQLEKASNKPKTNAAQLEKDSTKPKTNPAQLEKPKTNPTQKTQPKSIAAVAGEDDDDLDLVSDFRNLPTKFQESFVPDLERIRKSSKTYIENYNKEFAKGFKPYVGNRYAPTAATVASIAFIVIPLILVSVIFNRIKAYFSLQRLLIFIQIYLAIYFTILCLSAAATGLEPLRFFYAAAKPTYVGVQVLQTLAYVLYLLLLLMYLVLVFSTETVMATKLLGLAQTFVGFAVGLHYYMTVFHRAVLRLPPKTSWKAHGLYATCFFLICLLGRVDRRKKAYLEDGGEEGKKS